MAFEAMSDVYKITEMRDGCVYKTRKVTSIWLEVKPRTYAEMREIAQQHGGDQLASTTKTRITSTLHGKE
jgi:hypothetical protein